MMEKSSFAGDQLTTDIKLEPGPETIEDGKDGGPKVHCDLYNTKLVHKIAQGFIPGLAIACVDNTCGDIFRNPASVVADVRKDMVEYITQRSENFVAESVILEGGQDGQVSDHPYDIISDFVDDFARSKRNLFSRVSGWLLSENREDNIDDFVQEMEINEFWLIDKREEIAQRLLKNVDIKNEHHCDMKFHTVEELEAHILNCNYRSMDCVNEGCNVIFCACQLDNHDAICPLKIIPCEQNCSDMIMRRDMDRHCITICSMKLISCPFYAVGCQTPIPYCKLEQHRSDGLHSHMLFVLQSIHKKASTEDLKQRLEQLKDVSSCSSLAQARDVRMLTSIVKDLEPKLMPIEMNKKKQDNHEAEHEPKEVGNKAPDDAESGPKEVNNNPEDDLKVKQAEDIEAEHGPKELANKSLDDAESGRKEVNNKPEDDIKVNPLEDLEVKLEPNEVSIKLVEDLEVKLIPKELNTQHAEDAEDVEEKQATKEVSSSKPSKDIEEAQREHEKQPEPKEVGSRPTEDLELQLEKEETSNENLQEGYEIQVQTKDLGSNPKEELEEELGINETQNNSTDKELSFNTPGGA